MYVRRIELVMHEAHTISVAENTKYKSGYWDSHSLCSDTGTIELMFWGTPVGTEGDMGDVKYEEVIKEFAGYYNAEDKVYRWVPRYLVVAFLQRNANYESFVAEEMKALTELMLQQGSIENMIDGSINTYAYDRTTLWDMWQ